MNKHSADDEMSAVACRAADVDVVTKSRCCR